MKRLRMAAVVCLLVLAMIAAGCAGTEPVMEPEPVTEEPAGQDEVFHFTVSADMLAYHDAFGNLLQSIKEGPGLGVFHISIGDIKPIPANRAQIDDKFGTSAIWYPIIGNWEAGDTDAMNWLRSEYHDGNSLRAPLKNYTNQDGPTGSVETTYSWNHGNACFIALNQYWDGGTAVGSDRTASGDIVTELYDWLEQTLAANTKPFIFVFGHEPAFPYNRHVGDSLDAYPGNRDAFWSLLEAYNVQAFFVAHTHSYSKHQGDKHNTGKVWQLDVGNAGNDTNGDGLTYFDVLVGTDQVTIDVYRDNGTGVFSLAESINAS